MSLFAEEMQTRSTMAKNASEHKNATTHPRREGPLVFIEVPMYGLDARFVACVTATASELEDGPRAITVIDF